MAQAHLAAEQRHVTAPLVWACAAFTGGVLLNLDRVPAWAGAGALALVGWRLASARGRDWYPGILVRAVLALALLAVVLAKFHTLNGLAAGTTLLLLMAGLKLLETRTPRDQFVLTGAGLFLLLAACLDRQDLWRAPLYALEAWLCCAALVVIACPTLGAGPALGAGRTLRIAGSALLPAVPLALLLFLFFPRLPGAFWAIPRGEQAVTGLGDSMSPGGIARLVASYDIAFRVQFSDRAPAAEELYWRGPVLHDFDGSTWRRAAGALRARQPLVYLGAPYHYRVTLEPSHRPWWFALDTPARSPDSHVLLSYDQQLLATEPVHESISFEALSYTHTQASAPLDAAERRQDSALPRFGNPRTRALALSLHRQTSTDRAYVQAVLDYLRAGGFVYSLTPEPLGADEVDDLLFRTREGFCGHYASAFVTLMRAADIPARVVTGYLGGEWNPVGGYFVVRQSDAHAWAEVWLAERGWSRVDPTAVVAPERLQRGIFDLIPDELPAAERLLRARWLMSLLQRWDAANTWWTNHVVRFDYAAQLRLLQRFGVHSPDTRYLGWGLMLALCVWLALVTWQIGRSPRPARPDALARAYARLCRKLARIAPPRASAQGPLSLAAAVSAHRPDLRAPVYALLELYAQLRYGPVVLLTRARDVEEFRRAVVRLSLRRRSTAQPSG